MTKSHEELLIEAAWELIEEWLDSNSPFSLSSLNGPAMIQDLAVLEKRTGMTLEYSLRCFLLRHDGELKGVILGSGFRLLSAKEIIEHWDSCVKALNHVYGAGKVAIDAQVPEAVCRHDIKQVSYNRRWLPFADQNGSVKRYIDYDPGATGNSGQVIEVDAEGEIWKVLGSCFEDYIYQYAKELTKR